MNHHERDALITDIAGRVHMLNDWHNHVNDELTGLKDEIGRIHHDTRMLKVVGVVMGCISPVVLAIAQHLLNP